MSTRTRVIAAVAVALPLATALAVSTLGAVPAFADPTPASYAGVGSDTVQDVMSQLARTVTSSGASGHRQFESWDATKPGSNPAVTYDAIATKGVATNTLKRPNGSGDGIAALRLSLGLNSGSDGYAPTDNYNAAHGPVTRGAVDFARSSRGPNDTSDTSLTWIPFGTDAVDYAVKSGGGLDQAFASGLTTAQLKSIYACTLTSVTVGSTTFTIQPYVPQPGSGTRSFFEGAVGLPDASVNTTCVKDHKVDTGASIEEHDGQVLTDPTVGSTQYVEIAPISIAQNIAQSNHAATGVQDRRGSSKLGVLDGQAPTTGTAPGQVINASFPTAFTRSVYNVFKTTAVTGLSQDQALVTLFVSNASAVCAQVTTLHQFGFASNPNCGSTALKGKD
ncbi:hypothetical protein [Rugosimonospora africana]|uniref:PBP domain-containing protein n=1 Tax=Rugosimonospora africana TaxID=556532 RepID=A0A8J3VV90_9ACTN|nr:hypothetical protein [Rugosimonospora africana]GIH20382.1 hypothetical protein Raf01_85540 [Rugosimonospora africana]